MNFWRCSSRRSTISWDMGKIASVKGIQLQAQAQAPYGEGGIGPGYNPNLGPISTYTYAMLTLHFWRPPYYLRTDADLPVLRCKTVLTATYDG
jgi:hypothetical protein